MTEGTSLSQLLSDDEPETVETPQVDAAPEPQDEPESPLDGPQRGPDGKFVARQQSDVEEPGPSPDKLPKEDYKAIREEREKRQALQAELETLRQQVQSLQQPQEPPAPPPSVWDDEQAYSGHLVGTAVQQASFNAKLDMSEMLAAQAHEDFDDVKAKFLEMAQGNPALAQQALAQKHPWEAAYRIGKNAMTAAELGATNVDELKAKLREELMAEMQGQAPARPSMPPSLTNERNVGTRTGPEWTGIKPLSELLG
jgi:hypothetical protein